MSERDIDFYFEAILGLIIFSLLFSFTLFANFLDSLNPDSYLYIKYSPDFDTFIILILILMDIFFTLYFLNLSFNFRRSRNLNLRKNELLIIHDKIKIISFVYLPQKAIKIYYLIKYFNTSITLYMFLTLLIELSLISLIFYVSFQLLNDQRVSEVLDNGP